jgi:hypothetical protein
MERVKALDQDEVRSTPHIERFHQAVCETRPTRPSLGVGDRCFDWCASRTECYHVQSFGVQNTKEPSCW